MTLGTLAVMPRNGDEFEAGIYGYFGGGHVMVAECYKATAAEQLVNEHNAFADLVAACKALVAWTIRPNGKPIATDSGALNEAVKLAQTALHKAESTP